MAGLKVVSREYKVVLSASRFAGDERSSSGMQGTFGAKRPNIRRHCRRCPWELSDVQARRLIRFYDTPQRDLNANGYIFRERTGPRQRAGR